MHRSSLVVLLFTAAGLASCRQQDPTPADTNVSEPALNVSVPRPQQPIDRAALLAAIAEAASAAASGSELLDSARSLDGRQFEVRIRFGCRGPLTDLKERWLGWSIDHEDRRIRVRAMPTIGIDDPLVRQISGEAFEAVEGFWIPRPWLLQPVCPAGAAVRAPTQTTASGGHEETDANGGKAQQPQPGAGERRAQQPADEQQAEPVPASPRIGIAQFFTDTDPRTRRRDARAYEASRTLAEDEAISSQGYNLVLSGRLRALPARGVIHCVTTGAERPPECIVSAEFLRVWIEQPDNGAVLAEWGS